jgi:hypothetical protein
MKSVWRRNACTLMLISILFTLTTKWKFSCHQQMNGWRECRIHIMHTLTR